MPNFIADTFHMERAAPAPMTDKQREDVMIAVAWFKSHPFPWQRTVEGTGYWRDVLARLDRICKTGR